ncbi:MAG: MFS transporter, partial [Candidatus Bathyarchaeia archaeon]
FSRNFTQVFLVQIISSIGSGFGGGGYGGMGGPAWQALVADLVPSRMRARIMGLMGTVTGLSSLPSPIIGGYLYENYSPQTAFIVASMLGLLGSVAFGIFVKEPKKREI